MVATSPLASAPRSGRCRTLGLGALLALQAWFAVRATPASQSHARTASSALLAVAFLAGRPRTSRRVDNPVGRLAEFRTPHGVAFADRIPGRKGPDLLDQWVVADGDAVRLVSRAGAVRTLAVAPAGRGQVPFFTQVAVVPGASGAQPWKCLLWDLNNQRLWTLDAAGKLLACRT